MTEVVQNENTKENQDGAGAQEDLAKTVEQLKTELQDQKNKYLYLYSEFETFKKRAIKERSDLLKFGYENLARELLLVTDNLGRALAHTSNLEALVTGIQMVNQQLLDTLKKFGVEPVESLGKKFDPERHEAVGQDEQKNGSTESGTVVQEHQKGFTLHGRLLRPARVIIAK